MFDCPFCEFKYSNMFNLKEHIRYQHIERDHFAHWVAEGGLKDKGGWRNIP